MKALLVALTLLMIVACGKKDDASTPAPVTDPGRGGGSSGGSSGGGSSGGGEVPPGERYNWTDGATVDIFIDKVTLEAFLARPVNVPATNVPAKMNVFMGNRPDGTYPQSYAGIIRLAYEELKPDGVGTLYKEYRFEAAYTNTGSDTYTKKNRFNGWVNGSSVFKAYVQDKYGSLLFIVDGRDDSNLLSGRVYFHNFRAATVAIGPAYADACWLIQTGPYDCRDYLTGIDKDGDSTDKQDDMTMNMAISLNPFRTWISRTGENWGQMYKKLTTFSALNGAKALNN